MTPKRGNWFSEKVMPKDKMHDKESMRTAVFVPFEGR